MTLLTQVVFGLHFVAGLAWLASPYEAGKLVMNRPPLTEFAMESSAVQHEELLYLYERLASAMQVFVGMSGLVCGVNEWYQPFALFVYDALMVYALHVYMDTPTSPILQNLRDVQYMFGVGALLGLIGTLLRVLKGGFAIDRGANDFMGNFARNQSLFAPLTLILPVLMAFPFKVNLFEVASHKFQKRLLRDGQGLLQFDCDRILIGTLAICILSFGSLKKRDFAIGLCHMTMHFMCSLAFARVYTATNNNNFEHPIFLHFAVGIAHLLNFTRDTRQNPARVRVREEAQVAQEVQELTTRAEGQRAKQE